MKNTNKDEDGIRTILVAAVIAAIAFAAFLLPSAPTEVPVIEDPMPHVELIPRAEARGYEVVQIATTSKKTGDKTVDIELHPDLQVICNCESAGHSHKNKDGSLLSGYIDPDDKGECQINTRYHGETMERMGLDITDDADYRTYANYLYETQGKQPWSASASCWAPIIGYQ